MSQATKYLVSACLAGRACRYDGCASTDERAQMLVTAGHAVPFCPEEAAGLGTPREPAEIAGGEGADVLDGKAKVLSASGRDMTAAFLLGAREALEAARYAGIERAILKDKSPSCGSGQLKRAGATVGGDGVTTALLKRHGIEVEPA